MMRYWMHANWGLRYTGFHTQASSPKAFTLNDFYGWMISCFLHVFSSALSAAISKHSEKRRDGGAVLLLGEASNRQALYHSGDWILKW